MIETTPNTAISPDVQREIDAAKDQKARENPVLAGVIQLLKARTAGDVEFEKVRDRMHLSRRQANQIIEAFWAGYALGMKADKKPDPANGGDPGGGPQEPADTAQ
ncbi:MAG: hypothetical protein ACYC9Q_14930 [Bacillota bacterium]